MEIFKDATPNGVEEEAPQKEKIMNEIMHQNSTLAVLIALTYMDYVIFDIPFPKMVSDFVVGRNRFETVETPSSKSQKKFYYTKYVVDRKSWGFNPESLTKQLSRDGY